VNRATSFCQDSSSCRHRRLNLIPMDPGVSTIDGKPLSGTVGHWPWALGENKRSEKRAEWSYAASWDLLPGRLKGTRQSQTSQRPAVERNLTSIWRKGSTFSSPFTFPTIRLQLKSNEPLYVGSQVVLLVWASFCSSRPNEPGSAHSSKNSNTHVSPFTLLLFDNRYCHLNSLVR